MVAPRPSRWLRTEIYSIWVRRFGERHQWGRVLSSNAVAIPVDSILFVGLATLFGVFPPEVAVSIFWLNVIIKGAVTVISIPWIYLVKPQPLNSAYQRTNH